MINFSRAFDLAWERMMVILFRPFHAGKWFTIGFSAFLAGLLSGGNGFNFSYIRNDFNKGWSFTYDTNVQQFNNTLSGMQAGGIVLLFTVCLVLVLGLVLLKCWLGARGQFLFLDNLVRNRGAIAWPWRAYARPGNGLFLFYLLLLLVGVAVFTPFLVVGILAAWPMIQHHRGPEGGEVPVVALLVLVYLCVAALFFVALFLFQEWGVPLIFRNGLSARAAFVETWGLVMRHPGSALLFVLLRVALFIALVVVSAIVCCVSCCLELLPYLGTVLLLPAIVYVKCFSLDCLAQFGPAYDVWTTDVPPAAPDISESPTLLPPPG